MDAFEEVVKAQVEKLRGLADKLEGFLSETGATAIVSVQAVGAGGGGGNGKRSISPRVRALRRTQGQYMGFVRNLNAKDKKRVKKVREARGYIAATKLAKRLAGGIAR